jgi:hypothetical protein
MAGKIKVGDIRKLHAHLGALLADHDAACATTAEDVDLVNAERGGAKPALDSASRGGVSINEGIPGFDRMSKHRL